MIKWIDLEEKYIHPRENYNEIIGISIDDRDYYIDGGDNTLCVHVAALNGFKCSDLPPEIPIILAVDFGDDYIDQGEFPGEIVLIGTKLHCSFCVVIASDSFTGEIEDEFLIGFQKIYDRGVDRGHKVEITHDEHDYKAMNISFELDSDCDIEYVINYMQCEWSFLLEDEMEELTQLNEKDFTLQYVIPALEKLGFMNVRYEHGVSEYGKDVIYQYMDNFKFHRYGAVQVKVGNISGRADGLLSTIIEQIRLAFDMPYRDMSSQSEVFISQVVVICSGTYTNNAKEIISRRLKGSGNVICLDGQDIVRMIK